MEGYLEVLMNLEPQVGNSKVGAHIPLPPPL